MKASERDQLLLEHSAGLATLLERTANIYHLTEKLEQHQATQNGKVLSNAKSIFYIKGGVAAIFVIASLGVALAAVG